MFITLSGSKRVSAGEGALSFYLPGFYGDFGVAFTPDPGLYLLTTNTYLDAKSIYPVLPFPFETEQTFDGFAYLNLIRGFWITDSGGFLGSDRFAMGIRIPVIHIDLDVTVETPIGALEATKVNAQLGDFGFIPASLYWQRGNFHFNLYETITAPTAVFDRNDFPNISRNQWSFDTVLAMTWLDWNYGLEVSLVPGVILNTEDLATKYQTGAEFHLDYMFNKFFTPLFGIGVHGSYYRQFTGDSGTGAALGSFKGEASSIGPAILFRPVVSGKQTYFSAKWLHEYDVRNRFQGDLYTFTGGLKF
jgi:hypothetical protein